MGEKASHVSGVAVVNGKPRRKGLPGPCGENAAHLPVADQAGENPVRTAQPALSRPEWQVVDQAHGQTVPQVELLLQSVNSSSNRFEALKVDLDPGVELL